MADNAMGIRIHSPEGQVAIGALRFGRPCGAERAPRTACENLLLDPNDQDATPRANPKLERLAIDLDENQTLVAREQSIDRVIADYKAMQTSRPASLSDLHFVHATTTELKLYVSEATHTAIQQGQYGTWRCLNKPCP